MKPKNQHQMALYYLIISKRPFSLKDVINDSMFYKFQTRLSEIELEYGTIANRKNQSFKNKFGRKGNYTLYSCNNIERAKELYLKY